MISVITGNPSYQRLCKRVNASYADDIFQEVCSLILLLPEEKLPEETKLPFWFYRAAHNIMAPHGSLGYMVSREEVRADFEGIGNSFRNNEHESESMIKEAERFMLSLNEFENRVILLYNQLGDMKKVQRATGISYSALRSVKEKLKTKAKQLHAA